MLRLQIEKLSSSGEGIARNEGMVYFVPRALPGEECTVEIIQSKTHWRRARVVTLNSFSPQRQPPPCKHYRRCGGCQLQHLNYDAQLEFKRNALQESLKRIGHIEAEVDPVVSSLPFQYRRKVTFQVLREKGRLSLALHAWDNPKQLIPIDSCPQLISSLDKVIVPVSEWLNEYENAILPNRLVNAILKEEDSAVTVVFGTKDKPVKPRESFDPPECVESISLVQAKHSKRPMQIAGNPDTQSLPLVFRQVNADCEEKLYAFVESLVPDNAGRCVDAYCGIGKLTAQMASRCRETTGIESNRFALAEARRLLKKDRLERRVRLKQGMVEEHLPDYLPADFVVLDPPREGCPQGVIDTLTEKPPGRLAYISCHPAALARDLRKLLDHEYCLETVRSFDMFPQTFHLETVAVLRNKQ